MPDFLLPILFFVIFTLILVESIYYLNRHNHNTSESLEAESIQEQPKSFPLFKVFFSILIIAVIVSLAIFFWKRDATEKIASLSSPTPTLFFRPTATPISIVQNITSPTSNLLPTVLPTSNITPTPSKITTPSKIPTSTTTPIPTKTPQPTKTPVPTKTPIPTRTPSPTRIPTPTKPTATLSERIGDITEVTMTPTIVTATPSLTVTPSIATTSSETIIQPKLPVAGIIDQTLIFLVTGLITLLLGTVL